jgi:hypothetical protein
MPTRRARRLAAAREAAQAARRMEIAILIIYTYEQDFSKIP